MLTPERKWWYRQRGDLAVKALRRNGFEAVFLEDGANALSHVLTIVPAGAVDLTGVLYLEYNRRSV